jgi:hypothetical protein
MSCIRLLITATASIGSFTSAARAVEEILLLGLEQL